MPGGSCRLNMLLCAIEWYLPHRADEEGHPNMTSINIFFRCMLARRFSSSVVARAHQMRLTEFQAQAQAFRYTKDGESFLLPQLHLTGTTTTLL